MILNAEESYMCSAILDILVPQNLVKYLNQHVKLKGIHCKAQRYLL
jgi:hypothetical protein